MKTCLLLIFVMAMSQIGLAGFFQKEPKTGEDSTLLGLPADNLESDLNGKVDYIMIMQHAQGVFFIS